MKEAIFKLRDEIAETYDIPKAKALEIAGDEKVFGEVLKYEERYWTLRMINELMPSLHKTILKKAKQGWTANAKDGMTAFAIAFDKAFRPEAPRAGSRIEIGGKNVQINLGFKFNPYKKNTNEPNLASNTLKTP